MKMQASSLKIINQSTAGSFLRASVEQAYVQGRLSFGVFECAKRLESDPDSAMVVLLPGNVDCDDVTIRLQTTLVEAFCWEYDIRLLKVDNTKDICKILSQCKGDLKKLRGVKNTDFNCLLIESPQSDSDFSEQDKNVMTYCNVTSELLPQPAITLPSD